jgi:hypothetical protein
MLSSGMRVISEHCSGPDERALNGLVHFASKNEFAFLAKAYLQEAKNETTRQIIADKISLDFKLRFNLTQMLEAALMHSGRSFARGESPAPVAALSVSTRTAYGDHTANSSRSKHHVHTSARGHNKKDNSAKTGREKS